MCFDSAIDDKLDSWIVHGPVDTKTKGELLTEQCRELRDHEFVKTLGWEDVVREATDAANALRKFKTDIRRWVVGCELGPQKERFASLAKTYDAAFQQVANFEDTVD